MSETRQIALVSNTPRLASDQLQKVSAAIQRQLMSDLKPIWGTDATIDAFSSHQAVPPGYWFIIVQDQLPLPGVQGYHITTTNEPYALILFREGWEVSASHEAVEMVVDPFGNNTVVGPSPSRPGISSQTVNYLVEVCDPCQADANAYVVNDVVLSDFCTPDYYTPGSPANRRYSFTGSIQTPLDVLEDGYLNYRDIQNNWTRVERTNGNLSFIDVGVLPTTARSTRSAVDAIATSSADVQKPKVNNRWKITARKRKHINSTKDAIRKYQELRAAMMLREIDRLVDRT